MSRYIDAEKLKHLVNEKNYNARNKHFFFDCIAECDTADVAPVVHMTKIKITQCKGEGQGSCTRCTKNGKWNRNWMCFLYKIEGMDGCYCSDCVKELLGAKMDKEKK